jgi:exonuclease VII small subunit
VVEKGLVKKGSAGHKNIQAAVKRCDDEIAKLDKAAAGSDKGMVLIGTCEQILGAVTEATKKG